MALAVGDLIQIVDRQVYLAQEVLNVYYYRSETANSDGVAALESLATWFQTGFLDDVTAIQNTGLSHTIREIKNLSNGIEFYADTDIVLGQISTATTDGLPSYISLGFQLQRGTLATRNGYKRFAGLVEAQVGGNQYVGASGPIDAVEAALTVSPNTLAGDTFAPIIVKRPIPESPFATYVYSPVVGASFRGVGTQNTRKPGRGS